MSEFEFDIEYDDEKFEVKVTDADSMDALSKLLGILDVDKEAPAGRITARWHKVEREVSMSEKEKILLLQLTLEDLRGNWGWENPGANRRDFAMSLSAGMRHVDGMEQLFKTICAYETGEDGRYFRTTYPYGYYEMEKLHGLPRTIHDKSKEFQIKALQYLTYPDDAFEDYHFKAEE